MANGYANEDEIIFRVMEMEIKDMLSTGAMLIIGVITLKAFGGVQGITKMIGGIGDLLGTGSAGGSVAPGVGIIAPETVAQIDIISDMELPEVALIAENQEIESTFDTLHNLALIGGPIAYVAAPLLLDPIEESYKAESLKTYVQRTVNQPSYTPSETVTTPLGTTGWMQPTEMVDDPIHPGIGGR